jgi:ferredoxin
LELFVPHKSSNLDCTLCLACVDACPSNNVGLMASSPLAILSRNEIRSGVRRISARPDLAALVVVFVFGAFANAAGMVAPVVKHLNAIARTTDWPIVGVEGLAFLLAAIALPTALTVGAAALDRWCSRSGESIASVIARATPALVPIGAGMWLAHYGFHLFAGMWAFLPAGQRFMNAWGWRDFGAPDWSFNCCAPVADGILKFELLALDFGLLASLYVGYRIASRHRSAQTGAGVLASFLPWACLIVLLFAVGVWIVFQPMEMRGMLSAKGNA